MTVFGNDMRSLSGDSAIRKNVVVWVCGDDTRGNLYQYKPSSLRPTTRTHLGENLRQPFHHTVRPHFIRHPIQSLQRLLHPHPQNDTMDRLDALIVERIQLSVDQRTKFFG